MSGWSDDEGACASKPAAASNDGWGNEANFADSSDNRGSGSGRGHGGNFKLMFYELINKVIFQFKVDEEVEVAVVVEAAVIAVVETSAKATGAVRVNFRIIQKLTFLTQFSSRLLQQELWMAHRMPKVPNSQARWRRRKFRKPSTAS
jgi:hypothetical protein